MWWHFQVKRTFRSNGFPCSVGEQCRDLGWPAHFKKVVGESSVPMVNDPLQKRLRNMTTRAFTNQQLDLYCTCPP